TNSFLAGGGDGITTLGQGTNDLVGTDDLAALEQYLTANSSATNPIAPPVTNRITITQ
ncbi:MAG: bifunctional metallophosphatase/5'-nucleotidase, partial [Streptomyces sp.]|nr:bifunctional metallophosphatase/5'-nucleotidase [Streptomyces sp.]NUR68246.1 bifunctional metallophosphatase/5'-nucleotidase [Streptomyces sp.]